MTLRMHLLTCLAALAAGAAGASRPAAGSLADEVIPVQAAAGVRLVVMARNDAMIWNGLAVAGSRVFVEGPRIFGSRGPSVAEVDASGGLRPYPDDAWNQPWQEGADAARRFVSTNALRVHDGALWAVDTGLTATGGPVPGGAKLVRIDLKTNMVDRVIVFEPDVAPPGSLVDDVRFNGRHAYLSDPVRAALIVLDLDTGKARRVLERHPANLATRPMVASGRVLADPAGKPLEGNVDPLEVSPDGQWLYFGPLVGPWSKVPTRLLDDPQTSPAALAAAVRPWADLPPSAGSVLDSCGNLYFSEIATDSILKRAPDGRITLVARDPILHYADAMTIDDRGDLWAPVPQLDRSPAFNAGKDEIRRPLQVVKIVLPAGREKRRCRAF